MIFHQTATKDDPLLYMLCQQSFFSSWQTHPAPASRGVYVCVFLPHELFEVQLKELLLWHAVFKRAVLKYLTVWYGNLILTIWYANLDHTGNKHLKPPLSLTINTTFYNSEVML